MNIGKVANNFFLVEDVRSHCFIAWRGGSVESDGSSFKIATQEEAFKDISIQIQQLCEHGHLQTHGVFYFLFV